MHHDGQDNSKLVAKMRGMFPETTNAGQLERMLQARNAEPHAYPDGKLTETDQGELGVGIVVQSGKVVLMFGKDVSWVGFSPGQARQIAKDLLKRATEAEGKS